MNLEPRVGRGRSSTRALLAAIALFALFALPGILASTLAGADSTPEPRNAAWVQAPGQAEIGESGQLLAASGISDAATPNLWERAEAFFEEYHMVQQVLLGLLLFIAGWILAKLISWAVFRLLCRTSVDDKLAEKAGLKMLLEGDAATPNRIERFTAKIVYYLLMLLVVVGVLEFAGLSQAAAPIQGFVDKITTALPLVGKAVLILVIAYFAGTILQRLITGGLERIKIDARFSELSTPRTPPADAGDEAAQAAKDEARAIDDAADEAGAPFSQTAGRVVFWLIMVFGLAGAVESLEIESLALPLRNAVDQVVQILPNVALAALLVIGGYILGRIARAVVDNVLDSLGLNRLMARLGIDKLFGETRASGVLGIAAMVFILLQLAIAALNQLELTTLSVPLTVMMARFWTFLPVVAVSLLIVAVGVVGGRLLRGVVERALENLKFDDLMAKLGFGALEEREGRLSTPHQVVGLIVQIAVVLVATVQALENLELYTWAGYVNAFIDYSVTRVAVALLIVAVGLAIGNYVRDLVLMRRQGEDDDTIPWVATFARYAVLVFAFTMAIHHLQIGPGFVLVAFSLLFGGLCLALALALGLGSRDLVGEIVRRQYNRAKGKLDTRPSAPVKPSDPLIK